MLRRARRTAAPSTLTATTASSAASADGNRAANSLTPKMRMAIPATQ